MKYTASLLFPVFLCFLSGCFTLDRNSIAENEKTGISSIHGTYKSSVFHSITTFPIKIDSKELDFPGLKRQDLHVFPIQPGIRSVQVQAQIIRYKVLFVGHYYADASIGFTALPKKEYVLRSRLSGSDCFFWIEDAETNTKVTEEAKGALWDLPIRSGF